MKFNVKSRALPPNLRAIEKEVKEKARAFGLDFWKIVFEILDSQDLNEIAAFGGFPTRYPHWQFGMQYDQLTKGYAYGLSKIYELVINNDPCIAYLMRQNTVTDQKLVMAHVCGHADFFKNNYWFEHTNRKMVDQMANHGVRIRKIADKHGHDKVEDFIDRCLSLENLIDMYSPFVARRPKKKEEIDETRIKEELAKRKLPARNYMDKYINPAEFLEEQNKKIEEQIKKQVKFPEEQERDVLGFLLEHAPLKEWQKIILGIIREEAYYFAPQGMTKIMNEGWASFSHSSLMTQHGLLNDDELIHYADCHAGTMASSGGLNPYKIGIELFRDIEERWNKGKFGPEWERCDDMTERKNWDKKLNKGREKIFQVRKIYNDVTFIETFLTEDFCKEQKLFIYDYNPRTNEYVISSRDFNDIKEKFLKSLVNFGQPVIVVDDANYKNRGELYLVHQHDGTDLKIDWALDSLSNIQHIWNRPVNIETISNGKRVVLSYDGKKHHEESLD